MARDHAFTIAWFGVMAFAWFGWAQEAPPDSWRWRLGVGSILGVALAGIFGYAVAIRWGDGTALEGRYGWFGVLTAAELLAAGIGCLVLWRRGQQRWMAWWVAVVVGAHFLPLSWLLNDASLVALGAAQLLALVALVPRLRASDQPTSVPAGILMGLSLLLFAGVSVVLWLMHQGSPW